MVKLTVFASWCRANDLTFTVSMEVNSTWAFVASEAFDKALYSRFQDEFECEWQRGSQGEGAYVQLESLT